MFNPDKQYIKSSGIDRPIMYVYLAGRICGEHIDKCLAWRHRIINYYADYKGKGAYPIAFLDALNSKESDSVDKLGLTSAIPPNLIYDKDILSVEKADVVVAMMDDYMEEGIDNVLKCDKPKTTEEYEENYFQLRTKILERRQNWGTDYEVSIAMYLGKPVILVAGNKRQKAMLEKHPFMSRASVIVESVDELLDKKWLNILYKSIAGATY